MQDAVLIPGWTACTRTFQHCPMVNCRQYILSRAQSTGEDRGALSNFSSIEELSSSENL